MLDVVAAIKHLTSGLTLDEFSRNTAIRSSVLYHLIILGEAAIALSSDVQDAAQGIPWHQIRGTRNLLVHEYYLTDMTTVWDIVSNDLDPMIEPLRILLDTSRGTGQAF